jgi:ATP-dependent DNA ligase
VGTSSSTQRWHGKPAPQARRYASRSVASSGAASTTFVQPSVGHGWAGPTVKTPSGADWAHEIKHDGYRMIVRRNGPTVRVYSRNAYDWSARLSAIAAAAELIKAKSFTIDGEAVVLGPDGLSLFNELRRREAARTAILYAFDLIEHDGEDLRNFPFMERKAARNPKLIALPRHTSIWCLHDQAFSVSRTATLRVGSAAHPRLTDSR